MPVTAGPRSPFMVLVGDATCDGEAAGDSRTTWALVGVLGVQRTACCRVTCPRETKLSWPALP